MPARVAIANDYDIIVQGLQRMLEPYDDLEVVALAIGAEAFDVVADVVLLDTYGHPGHGLERVPELARRPQVGCVAVLSFQVHRALVDAALARGARSYLAKGLDADRIADALRRTASGESVVVLGDRLAEGACWPGRSRGLTQRESEVLALLASGARNRDLAKATGLTEHTVKSHLKRIYAKLGFTSRAQAAAFAHTDPEFARSLTVATTATGR